MRHLTGVTVLLAGLVVPASATADGGARHSGPSTGARSLGDPILPQLGNGGYDVEHYTIELDYDPVANTFPSARTTITARATQRLDELSLDFQTGDGALQVTGITVDGREAGFTTTDAEPAISDDPAVTQPMKLVVTPHPSTRPKPWRHFEVVVEYAGAPQVFVDPDSSLEGWIPACYPLNPPQTCDGAFVVNEPMGAQSWFPSNNHPSDKATFDTIITVPDTKTAVGIGELASRTPNGDGTTSWHWTEDDPTSTYLTTATVGDFLVAESTMTETSTGRMLPMFDAIDATATPTQQANINATLAGAPAQLNFLSDLFGRYPFDSIGAVADRAAGVGYALEVQTKPHYAGGFTSGNPSINPGTHLHELAHQWTGNSVTLAQWDDIWFNEGWANWAEWWWQFDVNGGDDPAAIFDDLYASTPPEDWALAPAVLDGDPANLFVSFPTYDRGAMTIQGYREIVGDAAFFRFVKLMTRLFEHRNISTEQFVDLAVLTSGRRVSEWRELHEYFDQWLYGTTRPTITPDTFGQ